MNYKKLDEEAQYKHRKELEVRMDELCFDYISEMIIECYAELKSSAKVGELVGMKGRGVQRWLKKWGIERIGRGSGRGRGNVKTVDIDSGEVFNMTLEEIALELGISPQAVSKLLQKGIKKFRKNWIREYGTMPEIEGEDEDEIFPVLLRSSKFMDMRGEGETLRDMVGGEVEG